jgi:protein-disulfide isomerase
VCLLTLGGIFFLILAAFDHHKQYQATNIVQFVNVRPEVVIGPKTWLQGSLKAPYTLVEFGDYECPPCRHANKEIEQLLNIYKGTLRFQFRNFPLISIHPLAHTAAVVAEVARIRGQFWSTHDALYGEDLTNPRIREVIACERLDKVMKNGIDLGKANATIDGDVKVAASLGVNGTPTFFICCPGYKVIRLTSIEQVRQYIKL